MEGVAGPLIMSLLAATMLVFFTVSLRYFHHDSTPNYENVNLTGKNHYDNMRPDLLKIWSQKQALLELFSAKNQNELVQARKEVKLECGSFVQINTLYCTACELFIDGAVQMIKHGSTQDDIVAFATTTCIALKIEDERVCKAIVLEFKDELFGVLLRLGYNSNEVCGHLLGKDCGAPFNPVAMWNVTFPDIPKPPVVPPFLPKQGSPTLRVLHLTDMHLDPLYAEGSNAECSEPLCCRAEDGPPDNGRTGAGKYGDYRLCDIPTITVNSLFRYLRSIQDQFDYVIFTGDLPPHYVWNQSRSDQLLSLNTFTQYVLKYLPGKKVYSTLGNHESAPVNSFPPPFIGGNDSEDWLYNETADNWLHWLPKETGDTIRKAGYYSVRLFPGLRLISLNMNMCNNGNWWLYINATDPADMLQWFISELQNAENVGDKVHVIGHIMPGCSCCLKPWSWNYYKIVNRYESTIVEQFFGHTHSMTYEVFYDELTSLRPLGVAYIPGSVTTFSDIADLFMNPGFRIYEIDGNYTGSTWRVQDYTNYYLNLTSANINGKAEWKKEYSAKEAYNISSLFPTDWNNLIYKMQTDDELFHTFCQHSVKSAPNTCQECNKSCKKNMLCALKSARNGDTNICNDL